MNAMTYEQVGTLINMLGLLVPLVFSLSIAQSYPRGYFRYWTLSYFCYTVAIGVMNFIPPAALKGPFALALFAVHLGGSWCLVKTAAGLEDRPSVPSVHNWLGGITFGVSTVLIAIGCPLEVFALGPVLYVVWTHLSAARSIWRLPQAPSRRVRQWLAGLIAFSGLWVLSFPFFTGSPSAWIGYVVAGLVHLLVGMQMVVYLIQDAAATLAAQNQSLQQVDRLKTNFISTVSHELRTPVTAIKSAAYLLDSPKISADELKSIIHHQTDALSRIVSDMLDVSLIDSGAMTYHYASLDLVELADEALSGLAHLFEAKGVAVAFEPAVVRVTVAGDADRLKQVLTNLLGNALKFTPEGGRVTVTVSAGAGQARVEVTDTGPGVPEGLEQKIFERFYQVDNSATRKVGGAGLGLAISRAIVEGGHGGRIGCERAGGGGSTFVFTLPAIARVMPPAAG